MARMSVEERTQRRKRVADLMNKSPVQRLVEAVMPKDEDAQARAYARSRAKDKRFQTGKHTATETGAKQLAAERFAIAQQREILNAAAAGTKDFEERAIKKNPRPTRTRK